MVGRILHDRTTTTFHAARLSVTAAHSPVTVVVVVVWVVITTRVVIQRQSHNCVIADRLVETVGWRLVMVLFM